MKDSLNLRRKPHLSVVMGAVIVMMGLAMLLTADGEWGSLIFGSLLAAGGLGIAAWMDRVVVDAGAGELVHQRGVFMPLRIRRYPIGRIRAVRVSRKTDRRANNEVTTFPVTLAGIRNAVVLNHRNPWFSRIVAERLARRLGVPMMSRVYGEPTTRSPEDLDTPLIERWIRDGARFERPSFSHGADLREVLQGSSYELSIANQYPVLRFLPAALCVLALPAVIDVPFAAMFHSGVYRVFAAIAVIGAVMSLAFVGRSSLTITPEAVAFRQGCLPLRCRLRLRDIEEMVVAADGITLIGDTGAVWIHWAGSMRDADYLAAAIPYQILRLGRHEG